MLSVIRVIFRRLLLIKDEYGFTFADILVGLTILSLTLVSVVPLFALSAKVVATSEAELSAVNLANKELEKVRSLDYDSVGTVGGNPTGVVVADRDQTFDDKLFHIKTRINWVDGEFDGKHPDDSDPRDYKKIVITVSWSGDIPANNDVQVSTLISRESKERVATGGNIEISVKDAAGNPLEDVHIQITTGPSSPTGDWTDSEGKALFYLLDPSEEEGDYTVSASKDGWTVRPDDQNQTCTVIINQTRTLEFILAKPGGLEVNLFDPSGNLVGKHSSITLISTELGSHESTSQDGSFSISDLFPGSYDLTAWATSYEQSEPMAIEINPDAVTRIDITLNPMPTGSLRLNVYDEDTGSPIANADVRIINESTGNETIGATDNYGVYEDDFEVGNYEIEISKDGYQSHTQNAVVVTSQSTDLDVYLQDAVSYGSIQVRAQQRNGSPRNNIRIRVAGSGYDAEKVTGSYSDGEVLFENLSPGTYRVYRWRWGWRDQNTVQVVAGQRTRVVYSW